MKLCLCKLYYTLLSLMGCKFCSIMSPWKMIPLVKKNDISNHWKLKISTCDFKIISIKNLTMKNITMKIWKFTLVNFTSWNELPWNYTCANGLIASFDLWVTHFAITCHHEIIHLLPWKMEHIIVKNDTYDLKNWYL
jgi:hypothetical protein